MAETLFGLLPSIVGQLGLAYLGYKSLPLLIQLALIVCPTLLLLVAMWMTVRKPLAAAILLPIFAGVGFWVWWVYPRPVQPPPTKVQSVSAAWATRENWWDAYWTDRHLPKGWKPYEALIRVRIGKENLYVVFKGGRVFVTGPFEIRAVEPLAGPAR